MLQNIHFPQSSPASASLASAGLAVLVLGADRQRVAAMATAIAPPSPAPIPGLADGDALTAIDREAATRLGLVGLQVADAGELAEHADALPYDRAVAVIEGRRGPGRVSVLDGPGLCPLVPFWEAAAARAGMAVGAVLLAAPPLGVPDASANEDGAGWLGWLRYVLAAERATRHLPRLIVTDEAAGAGPAAMREWIARTWGVVLEHVPATDPAQDAGERAERPAGFNSWVRRCRSALEQLAAGTEEILARMEMDRIQANLDAALAMFAPLLDESRIAADRLGRENARLLGVQVELEAIGARIDRDWRALSGELSATKVRERELETELALAREETMRLQARENAVAARDADGQAMLVEMRTGVGAHAMAVERMTEGLVRAAERRLRASSGPVARQLKRRGWGFRDARRLERHLAIVEAFLDDLPWEVVGVHPEGRRRRILAYLVGASEFLPDFPIVRNSEYRDLHPDTVDSPMTPLVHFITHGQAELRDPHPLFDTRYYLEQCPEGAHLASSPVIHYLRWGADKGHAPHVLLDARGNGTCPDLEARDRASGTRKSNRLLECIANPYATVDIRFDPYYYALVYPDIVAAGRHPLAHYLGKGWREGRNPNRWFDTRYYLAGDRALAVSGNNPLVHYVRTGWRLRRSPGPEFDAVAYASQAPALPADCDALAHYITHGQKEGRLLTPPRRAAGGLPASTGPVVLMVEALYPRPDLDSGSLDHVNFARIFQRMGYEVHYLALLEFGGDHDEHTARYRAQLEAMGIHCVTSAEHPHVEAYYFDVSDVAEVCFVSRVHFGGLQIETLRRLCPDARIVFNTVDLHFVREEREGALRNDPAMLMRAARTRDMELDFVHAADAAVVVSSSEKTMLDDLVPEAHTRVVPLIREFAPLRDQPFAARRDIAFVGGFNHQPNVDAVEHFLADIWPLVHRSRPDIGFRVVGANMPAEWARRKVPGVTFVGFVEELDDELAGLRMTVAPLRYGAGAKGKLVSSLAAGVPAVVSVIASEGMGLLDGDTVLVAADNAAFADAIVRLYDDEELWQRLSRGGSAFIREHYSIDEGYRIMRAILADIGLTPPIDRSANAPMAEEG